jgi:hypothetical protein
LKSIGIRFAVFDFGQGARGFFPSHAVAFKIDTVGLVMDDPVEDRIGDAMLRMTAHSTQPKGVRFGNRSRKPNEDQSTWV